MIFCLPALDREAVKSPASENNKKKVDMKVAIWDIDNVLADDRHRLRLIDWSKEGDDRYRAYNAALSQDPVCHVKEFNLTLAMGCTPVFFTGRPEYARIETSIWLQRRLGLLNPIIYMRENGTVGLSPATLKARMLDKVFYWHRDWRVVAAFDDLPAVIDMYRERGIDAVHLEISDHTAAYGPSDLVGATR